MTEKIQMGVSLYDLNKQIMSQLPPKAPEVLKRDLLAIGNGFSIPPKEERVFMFMCKEASNFTVLRLTSDNFTKAVDTLKNLIDERGELLSIEYIHGEDAYEIGLRDKETKEAFVYMLFPASWMLIEI